MWTPTAEHISNDVEVVHAAKTCRHTLKTVIKPPLNRTSIPSLRSFYRLILDLQTGALSNQPIVTALKTVSWHLKRNS